MGKAFIYHVHLLKSWNKSSFLLSKSLMASIFVLQVKMNFWSITIVITLFSGRHALRSQHYLIIEWNVNHLAAKTIRKIFCIVLKTNFVTIFTLSHPNSCEWCSATWCDDLTKRNNHPYELWSMKPERNENWERVHLLRFRRFFIFIVILWSFQKIYRMGKNRDYLVSTIQFTNIKYHYISILSSD